MELVTMTKEEYQMLLLELSKFIKASLGEEEDQWITKKAAKELLSLKSDSSFIALKNNREFRFVEVTERRHLYDRKSILDYLKRKAEPTRYEKV